MSDTAPEPCGIASCKSLNFTQAFSIRNYKIRHPCLLHTHTHTTVSRSYFENRGLKFEEILPPYPIKTETAEYNVYFNNLQTCLSSFICFFIDKFSSPKEQDIKHTKRSSISGTRALFDFSCFLSKHFQ